MNSRDELDEMLDSALLAYTSGEPLRGLEQRVLSRVHSAAPSTSRRWLPWATALAALALALFVQTRSMRVAELPRVVLAPPAAPVITATGIQQKHKFIAGPEPLTPEERALLRYVLNYPEEARREPFQPAEIQPLTIEPLRIDELPSK